VLNWFCLLGAMEALGRKPDKAVFLETGPSCRRWSSRITTPSRRITDSEEINMPTLNDLIDGDAQRLDTGFTFTEGPLYHPDGFDMFVDVRESKFYRIKPGEKAELLRENTGEGNGTTFDPQGRLIQCEGGNRRVTRWPAGGTFASSDVLMDRFDGKRLSRPNDVVCKSDGSVYFTNPGLRIPLGRGPAANRHVPMTRRMSQTGAVTTFARSSRSAAATGSSIPSFRPNRMASSRMRAAIFQIFRSAPGPNVFRKERAAA